QQVGLRLQAGAVALDAVVRPVLRVLDDPVEGNVGRVDDSSHGPSLTGIGPGDKVQYDAQNQYRFRRAGHRAARRADPAAPADRDLDPRRDPGRAAAARLVAAALPGARRRPGRLSPPGRPRLPAAHPPTLPGRLPAP